MCKNNERKNPKDQNDLIKLKRLALTLPIIISFSVAIISVLFIICKIINVHDISIEDILSSDIMTLLGSAISVWIGITIFNSVENSKIDSLDQSLENAKNTLDEMKNKYSELSKQLLDLSNLNCEINKSLFESEINKNGDKMVIFLFDRFRDLSATDYSSLYRFEKNFEDISLIHNSLQLSIDQKKERYIKINNQASSIKKDFETNKDYKTIIDYMNYRIGDCYFYAGYASGYGNNMSEQFLNFQIAYDKYYSAMCNSEIFNKASMPDNNDTILLAYCYNMLGECDSKMTEAYYRMKEGEFERLKEKEYLKEKNIDIKEIEKEAINNCKTATELMRKSESENYIVKSETYFRNYGWAILRSSLSDEENSIEQLKEARFQFRQSFEINKEKFKIYSSIIYSNLLIIMKLVSPELYCSFKRLCLNIDHYKITLFNNLENNIQKELSEAHEENSTLYEIALCKFPEQGNLYLYEILEIYLLKKIELLQSEIKYINGKYSDLNEAINVVTKYTSYMEPLLDFIKILERIKEDTSFEINTGDSALK